MIGRTILQVLKWCLALVFLGGLFTAAYWVNREMQAERLREGGEEVESPRRAKDGVIVLAADDATRIGLKEEPARAISWAERIAIYGEVVPNPKAVTEVRSPFAGTLRADPDTPWPAPGQWMRAGQQIGWIEIRVGPQERLSLHDNLNNARIKKKGAERVVKLQQDRVSRIDKMSRSQIVPGQQLDDARVLLAEAETQLAIASAAVELWQKALDEADGPGAREASTYTRPLRAASAGEVTELSARPGMIVEAGSLVAQLVDFRRTLVRLNAPPEVASSSLPAHVRLSAVGHEASGVASADGTRKRPESAAEVDSTLLGPAPDVDEPSQFVGYWYGIEPDPREGTAEEAVSTSGGPGALWRPGLHVKALVTPRGSRVQKAIAIPPAAVLFHQGRALVYVRGKPNTYERREVKLLGRNGDSWVVATREGFTGLEPDEIVVSQGAQALLSEEFRSDLDSD